MPAKFPAAFDFHLRIADQNGNGQPDVQVTVGGEIFSIPLPEIKGPVVDLSPEEAIKALGPILSKVPALAGRIKF